MTAPLARPSPPHVTPVAYLTTVVGRSCPVYPPFTLKVLIDTAVDRLHVARNTVKLFHGRRSIYVHGKEDANADQLHVNVAIPDGGTILVVGRPMYKNLSSNVEMRTVNAARRAQDSIQPPVKRKNSSTVLAVPNTSSSSSNGNNNDNNNSNTNVQSGAPEKGLYHFLKPIVFMLGRRGLRHLYYTARNQYGDFPRSFRDHPTMVSIVEYVDRNPDRLKEVLATILEEEPDLLRWIEAHAELFLSIINTPPQWQDETSPVWLVRHAKEVYTKETTKHANTNDFARVVLQNFIHRQRSAQEYDEEIIMDQCFENDFSLDLRHGVCDNDPGISYMASGTSTSGGVAFGANDVRASSEGNFEFDPYFQELQMVFRAWEISADRWSAAVGNVSQMQSLVSELQTRLHEAHATLLQVVERYLTEPPSFALLRKLNTLAQHLWRDGEQWFIEQNDVSASFETTLGRLLFEAGMELVTLDMNARSKHRQVTSNIPSSSLAAIEHVPLLDTATRWMTANGPGILARELLEYSVREAVSVVVYSRVSSSCAYAYVVSNGQVEVAPLIMDDAAVCEMKELERLYYFMGQTYTPKKWIKMRRVIRYHWNNITGRLYQRLLTPIEELLPPPVTLPSAPLSVVRQVCFIHTWALKQTPIPFPALRRPTDGVSCALQWAPFMAHRPWNLIQSAAIPWSNPVAEVPVITRLSIPVPARPTARTRVDVMGPRRNVVTYVNTKGLGCASFGDVASHKKPAEVDGEDGGLWQHVPWESWLGKALGIVRAGIPTHASIYGGDSTWGTTTALLIREVERTSHGWGCSVGESHAGDTSSPLSQASRTLECCRMMPYNQCSDLFVSHVVGRESGVGIHRAALLPAFKVMGRSSDEMYTLFLKSLVSSEEMTAAKAYRLALLVSWHTDNKEDPWRSASVMLFNYGGVMNTLNFLHGMYERRRSVKAPQISGRRRLRSDNGADKSGSASRETGGKPSVRNTLDGCYIERHAIDLIYDVVLHGLSTSRPLGEEAILDKMIHCIEENSVLLENSVERRKQGAEVRSTGGATPIASAAVPPSTSGTRVPFASALRNVVSMASSSNSSSEKNANVTKFPGSGQPPSDERYRPPGK